MRNQFQPAIANQNERGNHGDEILDPLTGELISIQDRDRLTRLHRQLEDVALELLSTCHQIRTALNPDSREGGATVHFDLPTIRFTKEGCVA